MIVKDSIEAARAIYSSLGFDSLPLVPKSKRPFASAWQKRLPERLWKNVPLGANIGIRGGGIANVAFIDCDERRAFESITDYLAGLGYRGDGYPVVQSASGEGRHIYVTLQGELSGDARDLSRDIGPGEFRYGPGAYVVAPPSIIKEGGYKLLSGSFQTLPCLELKDILPILGNREVGARSKPDLPRKARAILHGKGIDNYSSRSEAEQSLLVSMVNVGMPYDAALDLFNRHPCAGKYAELKSRNSKNAECWLRKSYMEAQRWATTHESKARRAAKFAIEWAEAHAWKGKTGSIDKLIFLAHAHISYKAGRSTYAAACRDLADMAGVSHMTAARSTWRLSNLGLIVHARMAVADSSNVYHLGEVDEPLHSPSSSTVRKCNSLSSHDVFRYRGLGKSAAEVYGILLKNPATIAELEELTGRHKKTIQRALVRMTKLADPLTGELLPMVTCGGGELYSATPVNLVRIAHAIGAAGIGEGQRKRHAKERQSHARELELGSVSRHSKK